MTKEGFQAKGARLAEIVLAGAGVGCLLALSYFVYQYAWTGQRQMTTWTGALIYYVAPALLASLVFASPWFRMPHKINLALFLCSGGVSIYGAETLISVWSVLPSVIDGQNQRIRIAYARAHGLDFDARGGIEVIEDLRAEGVEAVPDVFPMALLKEQDDGTRKSLIRIGDVEVVPLAGFSNKLVVFCNETGQWLTFRSDDHGFNNSNNLWQTDNIDIAAVGDSYVEGMCVGGEDNFTALMRKRYPATLNLGKQSGGPLLALAVVKEYARIVKPKVVLWFYYENDIWRDLMAERTSPLLMRYLTEGFSQDLFHRQPEIDHAVEEYAAAAYIEAKNKSRITSQILIKVKEVSGLLMDLKQLRRLTVDIVKLSALRTRLGLVQGKSAPDPTPVEKLDESARKQLESMRDDLDLFYRILLEARNSVNAWGGKIYFVFLPSWDRYVRRPGEIKGRPERDQVLLAAKKAGIPVIDMHPAFVAQGDPLALFPPSPVTSHYNERGHRLVAEEVLRSISPEE